MPGRPRSGSPSAGQRRISCGRKSRGRAHAPSPTSGKWRVPMRRAGNASRRGSEKPFRRRVAAFYPRAAAARAPVAAAGSTSLGPRLAGAAVVGGNSRPGRFGVDPGMPGAAGPFRSGPGFQGKNTRLENKANLRPTATPPRGTRLVFQGKCGIRTCSRFSFHYIFFFFDLLKKT